MMDSKAVFKNIFATLVRREGADKFLTYLESTDFFTAPASTRFHLSVEGGLARHSLNVYFRLKDLTGDYGGETIAICALLHDVCKTGYYKTDYRNVKNESGVWERVPYYTVDDSFPYGHGEKSVFLIERFMRLTEIEAMAIRWHMGGFDEGDKSVASKAFNKNPLAVYLHTADLMATFIDEVESNEKIII